MFFEFLRKSFSRPRCTEYFCFVLTIVPDVTDHTVDDLKLDALVPEVEEMLGKTS